MYHAHDFYDARWEFRDGAEMLRALLPNIWAHRAFASSSRFSFGNTGAILAWIAQDFSVLPRLRETFQVYHVRMDELVARYCFDSETLKQLARNPLVTIGGTTHRPLSLLQEDQMLHEIRENRAFLEGLIDTKVEHLSYLYGTVQACGEREFAASLRLGFRSAVTAEKNHRIRRQMRVHRLPRIDVTGRYWQTICNEMSHGVRTRPSTVPRRS